MERFIGWHRVLSFGVVLLGGPIGWAVADGVTLVSRTADGRPLSAPVTAVAISRDGNVIAFASRDSNLAADGTGASGVYTFTRREGRVVGLPTSAGLGQDPKGLALSPDGRHIAIVSESGEVFLHDRTARTTTRIMRNEPGPMGACSGEIAISADARFVAMTAPAKSRDPKRTQVWLMDRASGTVSAISLGEGGDPGGAPSVVAAITPDGRYVLFLSDAKDLRGAPGNGRRQVYRYDRERSSIELVSLGADGKPARSDCTAAAISDDGSVVAFICADDALVSGDGNKAPDVFVRDLRAKATERCADMTGGMEPTGLAISGDGKRVIFLSNASGLSGTGGSRAANVYSYSRADKSTRCISATSAGRPADGKCASPVTDATGGVSAFLSVARNLGAGGVASVFLAELPSTGDSGQPEVGDKELRQRLDLNGDGRLDQLDVDALVKQIGKGDLRYDLNDDGAVDLRDLNLLLQHLDGG